MNGRRTEWSGGSKNPAEAVRNLGFVPAHELDEPARGRPQGAPLDRPGAGRGRSNLESCGGGMRKRWAESVPDIRARRGLVASSAQHGIKPHLVGEPRQADADEPLLCLVEGAL